MATKYLCNYYSYKVVPQVFGLQMTEVDPELALEKQAQGHLANGHRYFFQDMIGGMIFGPIIGAALNVITFLSVISPVAKSDV